MAIPDVTVEAGYSRDPGNYFTNTGMVGFSVPLTIFYRQEGEIAKADVAMAGAVGVQEGYLLSQVKPEPGPTRAGGHERLKQGARDFGWDPRTVIGHVDDHDLIRLDAGNGQLRITPRIGDALGPCDDSRAPRRSGANRVLVEGVEEPRDEPRVSANLEVGRYDDILEIRPWLGEHFARQHQRVDQRDGLSVRWLAAG